MNLYIFVSEPFGKGQIKRHGLEFLEGKNVAVKIFNLLLLNGEEYTNQEINRFKTESEINQVFCESTDEVKLILKKIETDDIVLFHIESMHYQMFSYIIKYFNTTKIRYGFMAIMSIPELNPSLLKRIILKIEMHSSVFQKVIRRFHKMLKKPYFNPTFIITAGSAVYRKNRAIYGSKPKYFIRESIDYQNSQQLDIDFTEKIKNKKYILFIEQGSPFHPDFKLSKTQFDYDPTDYYKKINVFLSEVQDKTGLEVIISLPPKTELYMPQLIDFFPDQQIYINKTAELVKYSQDVILQYSTAVGFALIYKKPLFFFSLTKHDYAYNFTKNFAKLLGNEVVIIEDKDWNIDLNKSKIDIIKYNKYINNWIRSKDAIPLSKNNSFLNYLTNNPN